MSTPTVTARRNLVHRVTKLLIRGGDLTPWQLSQVQAAIDQLEEERFAQGERTMSEAELTQPLRADQRWLGLFEQFPGLSKWSLCRG